MRYLPRLAAPCLVAAVLVVAAAAHAQSTGSQERATVVLENGSRIEVVRAWQEGESYRLQLPSGGNVSIPASQVRRVSRNAADLPQGARLAVASAPVGGALPTSATRPDGDGAPAPEAASIRGSVPVDPTQPRPLAPPDPDTFHVLAPAPMMARAETARQGSSPTPRRSEAQAATPSPTAGRDLTPRPGRMQDLLQRINKVGGRKIQDAQRP